MTSIGLFIRNLLFLLFTFYISGCADGTDISSVSMEALPSEKAEPSLSVEARITAWVGEQDTLVDVRNSRNELTLFYRSREEDCDFSNYTSCEFGQADLPTGDFVRDTALTLHNSAYYALENEHGISRARLMNGSKNSAMGKVLSFRGKLWRITPNATGFPQFDFKAWSSNDGYNWRAEQTDVEILRRAGHEIVVFQNKIWLIAGSQGYLPPVGPLNDVWSSEDGINWQLERKSAEFPPVSLHTTVVFNDRLWLIGGSTADGFNQQVWSTSNGVEWEASDVTEGLLPRSGHAVTVRDGKLWLAGGWNGTRHLNDTWYSEDGENWQATTQNAEYRSRQHHQLVGYKDALWIMGGRTGTGQVADLWTSAEGEEWRQVTTDTGFSPTSSGELLVFEDQLLSVGNNQTQSWFSNDGESWERRGERIPIINTSEAVEHAGKLWAVSKQQGVWSSEDGADWTRIGSADEFYSETSSRPGQNLLSYNGRLWLITHNLYDNLDSIWSSVNGHAWRQEPSPPKSPKVRTLVAAAAVRNEIWLRVSTSLTDQSIYAFDGTEWRQIITESPIPHAEEAAFVSFQDKFWQIGGVQKIERSFSERITCGKLAFLGRPCETETGVKEVWSSENGSDWFLETDSANFDSVDGARVVVKNNQLWLFSGSKHWSSTDGIAWVDEGEFALGQNTSIGVFADRFWGIEYDFAKPPSIWRDFEDGWRKGLSADLNLK